VITETKPIQCVLVKPIGGGIFDHDGKKMTYDELPIGAMWDALWGRRKGPDGRSIYVMMPGRTTWFVDGRCSNCTRIDDTTHYCWVRHGEPPNLTVDKNGDTCSAGAGSIIIPGWHGFLRDGHLVIA
jgi:hypothetical protein